MAATKLGLLPLWLSADLPQNRSGFGGGIGRFSDRAANHDMAGSGGDGLSGSDGADLISGATAGWAHARSHDSELISQFRAQG